MLAFIARRLEFEPVVLVAAIRDGFDSPLSDAGLPALHLGALAAGPAAALLDSRAPAMPAGQRSRLLAEAAGNPLALVELPAGVAHLGSEARLPAWLPLTTRLERAFAARAADLPAATRAVLLVAAVNDSPSLSEALEAAAILTGAGQAVGDLVPAVDARLVETSETELEFRHPLMRTAIYQGASVAQRHAAHAALAAVLAGQPERRVWHRAASIIGPDEEVACELEQAAALAQRRGATAVAVAALQRAAALSDGRRLGWGGCCARRSWRSSLAAATWSWPCWPKPRHSISGPWSRRGWSGSGRASLTASPADPRLLVVLALAAPIGRGTAVIGQLERAAPALAADPAATRLAGTAAMAVGAFDIAAASLAAAAGRLRAEGRLGLLARALALLAWSAVQRADLGAAIPAAEEARRLAEETNQPLIMATAEAVQALLAGLRGDEQAADALAGQAERTSVPIGASAVLSAAQLARGLAALGGGRPADALGHLRRLHDPADPAYHRAVRCYAVGDLTEAAVRSGAPESIGELMDDMEAAGRQTSSPALQAGLRFARALLADPPTPGGCSKPRCSPA